MNTNFTIDKWTDEKYCSYVSYLKSQQDIKYKEFNAKLIPNADKDCIIGVRMPMLKKIAKEISKGNYRSFLEFCRCDYYEEIVVRGLVIGFAETTEYSEFLSLVKTHIPLINNWALCDGFCSNLKGTNKYKEQFVNYIAELTKSENPWEIRVGVVLLLSYYLENQHFTLALKLTDAIENDYYYVKMAKAWLVATAFAKNESVTMEFFANCNFDTETYNLTIKKARESYRISSELKQKLKDMKR